MEISADVQILATIQPGSVYKFSDNKLKTTVPHYFIVLNHNPHDDILLILVCSSSQIETTKKANKLNPKSTLVEISHLEYSEFTQNSIVNCNSVFPRTKQELINKLNDGKLKLKDQMSSELVEKLRKGVLDSPVVPSAQKKILEI